MIYNDGNNFVYKISIKDYFNIFFADTDISDIKAQAFGVLMDVPIPFSLEKPNVCEDPDSGIKCPLKKDQEAEYKVMFNLDKKAPTVIRFQSYH